MATSSKKGSSKAKSSTTSQTTARAAVPNLGDAVSKSEGHVGFPPWDGGQYALQIVKADDGTPTRDGDYMLKCEYSIIGAPDGKNEGRDPLSKPLFQNFVLGGEEWQADKLKNFCNAVHIHIDPETNYYAEGVEAFIGRKVAVKLGVGKNKQTGEPENKWNGFIAIGKSQYRDDIEDEYAEDEEDAE